jgi:hypothetical protein
VEQHVPAANDEPPALRSGSGTEWTAGRIVDGAAMKPDREAGPGRAIESNVAAIGQCAHPGSTRLIVSVVTV